ncbi:MAG TPA: EcsC family protein [Nitrospirota bacterium]|nr:EcsC family protein [Nitrospirota bacterium]
MEESDRARLREAVDLLENIHWVATLANTIGMPIEWGVNRLPSKAREAITDATVKAMRFALRGALRTINKAITRSPSNWWHKVGVSITGGVGGFFGITAVLVELPISTAIMLRSIADIARSEGEDLTQIDTQLACLEVFALGGPRTADDSSKSGYYAVRIALGRAVTEAADYIVERGVAEEGAPVLVRLMTKLAARFDVVVTEKIAAEMIPVIGAVGGAGINFLFLNHFQSMARGHFIVKQLERKYGRDEIQNQYTALAGEHKH